MESVPDRNDMYARALHLEEPIKFETNGIL